MSRTRLFVLPACCLLLALLALPAAAVTWNVNPDGSGHATTIKGGIALASAGDSVIVACGTYYERQIVLKSGVYLSSETGEASCVTIDCQGLGRGFYCLKVEGGAIVGFTVTNGKAPYGGGLFCISLSTPEVRNCVFTGNSALVGGGAYLHHSPIQASNTVFSNNSAQYFGGGAAVEDFSDPVFTDCTFTNNDAGDGGGLWLYLYSYPVLTGCTIAGNHATGNGGGIHCTSADPTIDECRITGNAAPRGGGLGVWMSHPELTACTISGNRAAEHGGGIFAGNGGVVELANTVVWDNAAPAGAEAWTEADDASITLACGLLDVGAGSVDGPGFTTWDASTSHADPQFCSGVDPASAPTTSGDFRVGETSVCLPANSPGCGRIGVYGPGPCSPTVLSLEEHTWGGIKSLYRTGGSR